MGERFYGDVDFLHFQTRSNYKRPEAKEFFFRVLSARARARARAPGPRMRGTSGPYPIRGLIICLPARAVVLAAFKMLIWRRPFNWYAAKTHVSVVKCKFEVKPANVLFNFPSWDRDWKLRPHKKALPYCGTAKNRSNYRASCDAKS